MTTRSAGVSVPVEGHHPVDEDLASLSLGQAELLLEAGLGADHVRRAELAQRVEAGEVVSVAVDWSLHHAFSSLFAPVTPAVIDHLGAFLASARDDGADRVRRLAERVIHQVRVSHRGLRRRVAEERADHRQRLAA